MTPANQLLDSLRTLRRQWRQRVILEAAVWTAGAVVASVLGALLVTTLFGSGSGSVLVARVIGYAVIIAAVVRYLALPLMRRASDEHFALYVEERAPELRQALLSSVHEIQAPEANRASPALTARLIERTVVKLKPLQAARTLERPRMQRAAQSFAGVAGVAVLLFVFGPASLRQSAKLMFAPWGEAQAATPVLAVRVKPGNIAIPRGAAVDIHASLDGFATDGAELVFRADTATEWTRIPMSRDSAAGGFTARLFDMTRKTEYYADANGVRSLTYRIDITDMPAMRKLAIDLVYPAYTGLAVEHIDEGGDVAAVIGTTVVVHATITKPVQKGTLRFDDGSTVPLVVDKDGRLRGSFRVKRTGYYRIDLVALDGANVPGSVQYAVDALEDHAPRVTIREPGRDTKVSNVDEQAISLSASDDYGVTGMELRYRVNGGPEQKVVVTDSTVKSDKEMRAAHTLFLEEMKLKVGDLIAYYGVARDGAGHEGKSDVYFLEVRPFSKNYRQAEAGGGGGGGGETPGQLAQRQRDVVAGTYNWLRDSAATKERQLREDMATLNIAEGGLREDVAALAKKIRDRGVTKMDSNFVTITAELDSSVAFLKAAEQQLVQVHGSDALPPEQQALQHLQRAEAVYRDVQLQQGQGGGGGGSRSNQRADELADLFELQTDKLKNQYEEMPQAQQQQQAQREVDATLERLKELAARQQQENERMQRLAEQLRERLPQASSGGGGGGGGSQRDLARQAEEEARRLERLAREQKSEDLADAAQRMQQAADAMRKAASGNAQQGSAALDQLKSAAGGIEGARSSAVNEGVKRLAQQAKDLENRQRETASDVKSAMTAAGGNPSPDVLQKLNQKKDELSRDVGKLEADADRLARDGKREQPGASGKLSQATDAIREQRVRDKLAFSKNVLRSGSTEYANAFENALSGNLADVSERMKAAADALSGESASQKQERSLAKTRELVKGLESLQNRTAGGQQGQQGQQGKGQQGKGQQGQGQGQQGQQGQKGQGQQGQQGQAQGQGQQGQQGQGQGQGQGQQGQGQQGQQGQQGGGRQVGQGNSQQGGGGGAPNRQFNGTPGQARQFSREFGMRRAEAQDLRKELAAQGMDVSELDKAIDELGKLETNHGTGDPAAFAALQSQAIESLKSFEFSLYRKLALSGDKSPTLGARTPVPEEYRAAVEEYYRQLAAPGKKKQ